MSEEAGSEEPKVQDITSLDTYSLIGLFISLLSAKAWQTMGLRVKPGTDKIEKDLADVERKFAATESVTETPGETAQ